MGVPGVIKAKDSRGRTPVQIAIENGHASVLRTIADATAQGYDGSALYPRGAEGFVSQYPRTLQRSFSAVSTPPIVKVGIYVCIF